MLGIAAGVRPRILVAQTASRPMLLGILAPRPAPNASDEALLKELRDLGHVEGRSIRIEFRGVAGNPDRLDTWAEDLVKLEPAVMFASGSEAARAAMKA